MDANRNKNFTNFKFSLLSILLVFSHTIFAQTNHIINSGNFYYTPSSLTIDLNDTVTWVNDGGYHNVNFNISSVTGLSYNNPVSFITNPTTGSFLASYVFTVAGNYNYDCSVGAHAANGMTGSITVNPSSSLDCNNIPNGPAMLDACGVCQLAYIYNFVSHAVTFVNDTSGVVLGPTEMLVLPNNPSNPYWNSSCVDCNGVLNGPALLDSCGVCQLAYIYNYVTHVSTFVNDTVGIVLGPTEMLVLPNNPSNPNWNSSCVDCNGILNGPAMLDSCGVCQLAYIYNYVTHVPTFVNDTVGIVLGPTEMLVMPNSSSNPVWNSSCAGCTDSTAYNYDPLAVVNDGSCLYPPAQLFFSEYAEGTSNNKYFEVYNPSNDTVSLDNYAYPSVANAPSTPGQYEYWNDFDFGAVILPKDVYVVAHPSADPTILANADETHPYLSNGDDGYALVYGNNTKYAVMDWLGDWNGDPGSGWSVAGVSNATKDHTLVRKCSFTEGDTSWSNAAGTNAINSQWEVYPQNTWTYLGSHVSPCPIISGCTDSTANNYNALATIDDGSCIYPSNDCNGVLNGPAMLDSCGACQLAYIYNFVTHIPTFVNDTVGIVLGPTEMLVLPNSPSNPNWNSTCVVDCNGVPNGPAMLDSCGVCQLAYIYNFVTHIPTFINDTSNLNLAWNESLVLPNSSTNPLWNSSCTGCTDSLATNYNPNATIENGSCTYPAPMANLYFSEYAEGSSNNKYFEVYNASNDTVDLSGYAYPNVSNAPSTPGQYEYWNDFDAGAVVAPGDVYIVAHPSADPSILAEADETHYYLSNGDDGYALVYGTQNSYTVIDWLGDWDGDPGSGWSVAGVSNGTKDHTLVRKCSVTQGNTSWTASAGTNTTDSEWEVLPQNTWTYIGSHVTPCPPVYDCNGIANGPAMLDSCGVCQLAYIYNYVTHIPTFVNDTAGIVLGPTEMLVMPNSPSSPLWNSSCTGCTDSTASNYNPNATIDDGSCIYPVYDCNGIANGPAMLDSCGVCQLAYIYNYVTHIPTFINDTVGIVLGPTEMLVMPNSPSSPLWNASCTGCTDSTALNYNPNATINDGSCIAIIYGCTDSTALNYYPGANTDDGSCQYATGCSEPVPTGIYSYDIIDERAKIAWDNMNDSSCMVDKYRIRYREVGASSWSSKTMQGSGLCIFGLNTTVKQMLNLNHSTTYEYYMKAWYCGGNANGTGWSAIQTFTTQGICPDITNLTVTPNPNNNTRATFCWDTTGTYLYARVKYRVDTSGSSWINVGGFGVYYPTTCKVKFGMVPGQNYRGTGRAFCDPNMSAYNSNWTPFIFWTQPGSIRVDGGTTINNLDVYPNPSRDIFNVSFTSEDVQDLEIRILSVVGEAVYTEDLQQFVGEYTKAVDLENYSKGIYFLEITTNSGVVNKKLILQ